jgi:hypothetical protein
MNGEVFQTSLRCILVVSGLLSICLLIGCEPTRPEYAAFFTQDVEQQRKQAKGFPVEKQIDYYLAGKRYVHPPSSVLMYVIAERGKEAVPPVLKKMKEADNDSDRLELLDVIWNINEFHAKLNDDETLIAELRGVVSKIQDPQRKPAAERMLKDIVGNRSP